jgi:hypothetical protein
LNVLIYEDKIKSRWKEWKDKKTEENRVSDKEGWKKKRTKKKQQKEENNWREVKTKKNENREEKQKANEDGEENADE